MLRSNSFQHNTNLTIRTAMFPYSQTVDCSLRPTMQVDFTSKLNMVDYQGFRTFSEIKISKNKRVRKILN